MTAYSSAKEIPFMQRRSENCCGTPPLLLPRREEGCGLLSARPV